MKIRDVLGMLFLGCGGFLLASRPENGVGKPSTPRRHTGRVIVKFHDQCCLPYEDTVDQHLEERKIGPWGQLKEQFAGIEIQRLFKAVSPDKLGSFVDECRKKVPTLPDLQTYFAVCCPSDVEPHEVAKALASWRKVQAAYVESEVCQPPRISPGPAEDGYEQQGYLHAASIGIDAVYASSQLGGNGRVADDDVGLAFVDIEHGWDLSHEDLPQDIELIHGDNRALNREHGTAVLGIVLAVPNNERGVIGIAPYVKTKMVASIWPSRDSEGPDRYDAVLAAINRLRFGDVLLIEDQLRASGYYPTGGWRLYKELPVEFDDALFDLIQMATQSRGIIVVEAAGNGGYDLDKFSLDSNLRGQDSGAIMVAAGTSSEPHGRHYPCNFGSRINCYAWGDHVYTTGEFGERLPYVSGFGNTSGAAAIIAGAALAVQGFAQANRVKGFPNSMDNRFSPTELRDILSDQNTGTPSANPSDRIGVMPDLKKIMAKYV